MNYKIPSIDVNSFTCPHCNTLAQQKWDEMNLVNHESYCLFYTNNQLSGLIPCEIFRVSTCLSCMKYHLWIGDTMVQPSSKNIPLPNEDMPEDVSVIYHEAREVYEKSARSAAALLRLALQHLCIHLGGEGKNINDDIGKFVRDGAVDARVQKSLDIVRVTGNNAVHPGQLDIVDNKEIAARLFGLLNFIVDAMITQPQQIETFFSELPQGARDAIERRDS